jgi:Mn-containing catalase
MFLHRKELIQPADVGTPDARFGTCLLEQFGGATGELTAALQYWVQSFHVENAGINLSRDEDVRGPWNEEPDFDYVANPQPKGGLPRPPINADDEGHASRVSSKPKKRN